MAEPKPPPKKRTPKPPNLDPYDLLSALVAAVIAAPDRVARMKALAESMPTGAAYDALARLSTSDPGHVDAEIARLGTVDGMGGAAKDFASRLRAHAKAMRKNGGLRLVQQGEVVEDFEIPDGLSCPNGYVVAPDGVFRLAQSPDGGVVPQRLTFSPVILTRSLVDIEDRSYHVEVTWIPHGARQWKRKVVPRGTALAGRNLITMQDAGAPVVGETVRQTATFLSAWEAHNAANMERVWTSSRMGWMGEDLRRFLRGTHLHGGERQHLSTRAGMPPGHLGGRPYCCSRRRTLCGV
jgi:hypothetical protein